MVTNVVPLRGDGKGVWFTPWLGLQQKFDAQLAKALASAATSAAAQVTKLAGNGGVGAAVKQAQLTQVQVELHKVMASLFQSVGDFVTAAQHTAESTALEASFNWDSILLNAVYEDDAKKKAAMLRYLQQTGKHAVESLVKNFTGHTIPLSQQVYKTEALAQGWVYNRIQDAIGRGATWKELAEDVKEFIHPSVPGGASYAASRLARTEINNTYHAVSVAAQENKPWVEEMSWNLSKSHPKPDICNKLAAVKYKPQEVPSKPHPQCFCYVVPELITTAEFLRRFNIGEFDTYLQQTYGIAA